MCLPFDLFLFWLLLLSFPPWSLSDAVGKKIRFFVSALLCHGLFSPGERFSLLVVFFFLVWLLAWSLFFTSLSHSFPLVDLPQHPSLMNPSAVQLFDSFRCLLRIISLVVPLFCVHFRFIVKLKETAFLFLSADPSVFSDALLICSELALRFFSVFLCGRDSYFFLS